MYERKIKNNILVIIFINLINSDYVGSVSIDKDGNDYIVKTYIKKITLTLEQNIRIRRELV